jgi:hypothetical protein
MSEENQAENPQNSQDPTHQHQTPSHVSTDSHGETVAVHESNNDDKTANPTSGEKEPENCSPQSKDENGLNGSDKNADEAVDNANNPADYPVNDQMNQQNVSCIF